MRRLVGLFSLAALALSGCVNHQKAELAADVAKNWCLTIRASQVLPTYPLTEDLQPGDLFLSQQPIEDDVKQYQKEGFLPLTHLVARMSMDTYPDFYRGGAYGVAKATTLPAYWQFGPDGPRADNPYAAADDPRTTPLRTNWAIAPRGSFPSYSFSVDQSAGFKAGLPLNGVPIALGVLGSDHAEASVTLGDAYTFGIDEQQLTEQVRKLIDDPSSPAHLKLKAYEPTYTLEPDGTYRVVYTYLRLVTRVYYVKKVTITVRQTRDRAGELSGGVAQNLNLFGATPRPAEDFKSLLDKLNNGLAGTTSPAKGDAKGVAAHNGTAKPANDATAVTAVSHDTTNGTTSSGTGGADAGNGSPAAGAPPIGGSLKFANVTASSVTMDETFDRPLVIGYLAVDIPIDYNGALGARPISTLRRIERAVDGTPRRAVYHWAVDSPSALNSLTLWVGEKNGENDNAGWLRENDFEVVRDAAGTVDARRTAALLLEQLRQLDVWHSLYQQAFDREKRHRFNRLNARIIGEIIERPPGTGIDFVIEARTNLEAVKAKARTGSERDLERGIDNAQSKIERLNNPAQQRKLQNELDEIKTRYKKK